MASCSSLPPAEGDGLDLPESKDCPHSSVTVIDGSEVCYDCGEEIIKNLSYSQDWKYHSESDDSSSNRNSNPSRCTVKKVEEKNIYKDIQTYGIPIDVATFANRLYMIVSKGAILRGNPRKGLIFACVFNSYKSKGSPVNPDRLSKIFNITNKVRAKGIKNFCLGTDKSAIASSENRIYIRPTHYVPDIMKLFHSSKKHTAQVVGLCDKIMDKSFLINRSNPRSIACGLVFYYCRLLDKDMSCKSFSSVVGLSDITLSRIHKVIAKILDRPE